MRTVLPERALKSKKSILRYRSRGGAVQRRKGSRSDASCCRSFQATLRKKNRGLTGSPAGLSGTADLNHPPVRHSASFINVHFDRPVEIKRKVYYLTGLVLRDVRRTVDEMPLIARPPKSQRAPSLWLRRKIFRHKNKRAEIGGRRREKALYTASRAVGPHGANNNPNQPTLHSLVAAAGF